MAAPTAKQLIKEIEDELEALKSEVQDVRYDVRTLKSKTKELDKAIENTQSQLIPLSEYNLVKSAVLGFFALLGVSIVGALLGQVVTT